MSDVKLGNAVRLLREARGLRLLELARRAHISTPSLCLLEKGSKDLSLAVVRRIAEALDIPLCVFLLCADDTLKTEDTSVKNIVAALQAITDGLARLQELIPHNSTEVKLNGHTKNDAG